MLVELRVCREALREAAEVAQREDVALKPFGGEQADDGAHQAFQATVIQLVHDLENPDASRHSPDARMANPFSDSPEGILTRGRAHGFTPVGGNHAPPSANAAA